MTDYFVGSISLSSSMLNLIILLYEWYLNYNGITAIVTIKCFDTESCESTLLGEISEICFGLNWCLNCM